MLNEPENVNGNQDTEEQIRLSENTETDSQSDLSIMGENQITPEKVQELLEEVCGYSGGYELAGDEMAIVKAYLEKCKEFDIADTWITKLMDENASLKKEVSCLEAWLCNIIRKLKGALLQIQTMALLEKDLLTLKTHVCSAAAEALAASDHFRDGGVMNKEKHISQEISALLDFYSGRKLISVNDIRDFSAYYSRVLELLKGTMEEQRCDASRT